MSFQAMAWAAKQKVGNATGKAILLMLANYADQEGGCFPSQEKLAEECECTRQTISRFLGEFEKRGLIARVERRRQDGYRSSDEIRLNFDYCADEKAPSQVETSCNNGLRKNISRKKFLRKNNPDLMSKDVTAITYQDNHQYSISQEPIGSFEIHMPENPEIENLVEDLGNPMSIEADQFTLTSDDPPPSRAKPAKSTKAAGRAEFEREFEAEFWPQVVKKISKADAKKAFVKAREKASLAEIVSGLMRYQAHLRAKGTELQFWAHPATFLNGERWADEYAPEPENRQNTGVKHHEQHYRNASQNGHYNRPKTLTQALYDLDERINARQAGREAGGTVSGEVSGGLWIDERGEEDDGGQYPAIEALPFLVGQQRAGQPNFI